MLKSLSDFLNLRVLVPVFWAAADPAADIEVVKDSQRGCLLGMPINYRQPSFSPLDILQTPATTRDNCMMAAESL